MKVEANSFIRFVYPFLFDASDFAQRVAHVDAFRWADLGPVWEKKTFPERELLPHVARFLNPGEGDVPTVRLWQVAPKVLQSPGGLGGGAKNPGADWCFVQGSGQRSKETRFAIEDCQLTLFHSGVGFLSVRIRPEATDVPDWLDFLHYFRYLRRERNAVKAVRRVGFDQQLRQPVVEDYFPALAGGHREASVKPSRCFDEVVEGLLRTAAGADERGPWWYEVFLSHQAVPYAVLFVAGAPSDETDRQRLLYKLHNFFHAGEGENPAPGELVPDQPHLLPYADGQWFLFSLDGGSFVAFDPPRTPFFGQTLPEHLDGEYLLLFLLALQQRFALMSLSEQVTRRWLPAPQQPDDPARRERIFRRIRDALLSFTARGYFAQVMQRRHHHRCYLRWQETFQIERLYREVSDEVRDMHQYLQMEKTERIERLAEQERDQSARTAKTLNILAAFLLLPSLVLSFLDAVGNESWVRAWCGLLLALVAGSLLMIALQRRWFTRSTWRTKASHDGPD